MCVCVYESGPVYLCARLRVCPWYLPISDDDLTSCLLCAGPQISAPLAVPRGFCLLLSGSGTHTRTHTHTHPTSTQTQPQNTTHTHTYTHKQIERERERERPPFPVNPLHSQLSLTQTCKFFTAQQLNCLECFMVPVVLSTTTMTKQANKKQQPSTDREERHRKT